MFGWIKGRYCYCLIVESVIFIYFEGVNFVFERFKNDKCMWYIWSGGVGIIGRVYIV